METQDTNTVATTTTSKLSYRFMPQADATPLELQELITILCSNLTGVDLAALFKAKKVERFFQAIETPVTTPTTTTQ
jgi:hypothetical protein